MKKFLSWFGYTVLVIVITFAVTNTLYLNASGSTMIRKQDYVQYKKYEKTIYLMDQIEKNYYKKVDENDLLTGMNKGLFMGLNDPYSEYMTKQEFDTLMEGTSGNFVGIGVYIGQDNGFITIISPIQGTPAEEVGLKAGDKILKVNDVAYTAAQVNDAISVIKVSYDETKGGKKDFGSVKLTIRRGDSGTMDFTVPRREINVATVKSEMKGNIGYLTMSQFGEHTGDEFNKNMDKVLKDGAKGIIIDLRNNPGGLLTQVKAVADRILGEATIVYTQNNKGKKTFYKSTSKEKLDLPLVLLVNKGSASASEILAGAVRDNEAGTLVGETTFGKGLVQQVVPLAGGGGYKLTTEQYFTPKGEYINDKGIDPDVKVVMPEKPKTDIQLEKALELMKEKIK